MAERRMFARSIVLSDAFLDMPMSARCLYFTLGMLADDDGFVGNPKSIMRQCGSSIDDLNILLAKRYVLGFETGVIVIKHWRINNFLRNDRHHDTTYVEEMETLTLDEKGAYTELEKQKVLDFGLPSGNQLVDRRDTENSIGKDRLNNNISSSKDSEIVVEKIDDSQNIEENDSKNIEKDTKDNIPYKNICSYWNERTKDVLPSVISLTKTRREHIRQRWSEFGEKVYMAIDRCIESDFLSGRNGKWTGCCFDWLFRQSNMPKVIEGNYTNRNTKVKRKDYSDISEEDLKEEFRWK